MIESEWLACDDPERMLSFVREQRTDRKLRLFGCACCRRIWDIMTFQRSRYAVETAEQFADGIVSRRALANARKAAQRAERDGWSQYYTAEVECKFGYSVAYELAGACGAASRAAEATAGPHCCDHVSSSLAVSAVAGASFLRAHNDEWGPHLHSFIAARETAQASEKAAQVALLRDIFGNPYRPVSTEARWLAPAVVMLAQVIYAERSFQDLPILADALEDAGCGNADILSHCRGPGPHVRGCWALDLILRKS
jgi:hypothetical protein